VNSPWKEAKSHFAGGVNSPVRAFNAVGGDPIFMSQALGPFIFDSENKKYIDYCLSWGAILLGHANEKTVQAIRHQAMKGTSFGTATVYENQLAGLIKKAFPKIERLRFTSSGTEAVMSAIRLARGVTARDRIVKFEGCYHGHADSLLVKAGSGLATFASPNSAGVPDDIASLTSVLPYNDAPAVKHFFKGNKDVACVIVEPIAGNMGVIPGTKEFLETLRRETKKAGTLLIFDEVISGFRVTYGGAQHIYGIEPDITILGKIIGGGLPVGAFGASEKIMNHLSPNGKVYQAGTLSGNPLSMAAGISVLSQLSPEFYKNLNQKTAVFLKDLISVIKKKKRPVTLQAAGSMFTPFFTNKKPVNFSDAAQSDTKAFAKFFHGMLKRGVYLPPSAYEAYFISESHSQAEFKRTLEAIREAL
jgi:glutamate-1-semialdehyde 2,1-aminomutase